MTFWGVAILLVGAGEDGWSKLRWGEEEIEVFRDSWGIPHVFARTVRGAFWAEGYTEAEDRIGQMEALRRAALGRASELKGRAALGSDRGVLRRGYTEDELRGMFEEADPRFRKIVSAYCEGVNAFLRERRARLLGAESGDLPGPWRDIDCVAIGVMMARRFGEAGDVELTAARILEHLTGRVGAGAARRILNDLLRGRDPSAPTTLNDHLRSGAPPPAGQGGRAAPGMGEEAFAAWSRERAEERAAREVIGIPVYGGSNAWVVGPAKSATGRPMLYGGPMMGFGTPSICNEIHLVADGGLHVAGMSFPGVPGVMIGWNDRIAWTTTSGGADLVDVFVLELNPADPEEYRYGGGWRRFDLLDREIRPRGEAPERVRVRRWAHGPLAGDPDPKNRRAHGLRMSFWRREHRTFEAVLEMNFARSLEDFARAVRKVVTSHNFFCASSDGRIGFWYAGAHPVRRPGHDVRLPQAGDGSMDWEGILPFEKWPQGVDPPGGFFANWNNKPSRDWEPTEFGKVFWGKKILDVLESEEKIDFGRLTEIARLTAYHSYLADYFAPFILEAARGSGDPRLERAAEVLAKWDHMESEGAPGPVLVERWVRGMAARVFQGLVDPLWLTDEGTMRYLVSPLLYLLEGDRSPVRLGYDYVRGRDLRRLAREALQGALGEGGIGDLAWREPAVDFRDAGGRVKSKRGRGTYQMAVELADGGPRAVTLAAPGQSEHPESPHYRDQVELFRSWRYKPFLFSREEMK